MPVVQFWFFIGKPLKQAGFETIRLVGMVSADDILDLPAEEMTELAKVAPREQEREAKTRD